MIWPILLWMTTIFALLYFYAPRCFTCNQRKVAMNFHSRLDCSDCEKKWYEESLKEIELLMRKDPPLGSPEGERLNDLAIAVERYEKRVFF